MTRVSHWKGSAWCSGTEWKRDRSASWCEKKQLLRRLEQQGQKQRAREGTCQWMMASPHRLRADPSLLAAFGHGSFGKLGHEGFPIVLARLIGCNAKPRLRFAALTCCRDLVANFQQFGTCADVHLGYDESVRQMESIQHSQHWRHLVHGGVDQYTTVSVRQRKKGTRVRTCE
jgi:hypothetical protein